MIARPNPAANGKDETELLLDVILEAGTAGSIPISGDEMSPTLVRGDRVVVTPFLGLPGPGQMVIARHGGRLVARRLVAVRLAGGRRRYRLEADTDPAQRIEVLREALLGRPSAVIRQGLLRPFDGDGQNHRTTPRDGAVRRRD